MKLILSLAVSALVSGAVLGATYTIHRSTAERYATVAAADLRANVNHLASRLEQSVNHQLQLTRGLAAFVQSQPKFNEEEFQKFARALAIDKKGIRSLQLAPNGVITFMTNKAENAKALGYDLFSDTDRRHLVQRAVDKREYVIAGPMTLVQGGVAIIARLPIFLPTALGGDQFWGFATILIDPNILLREAGVLDGLPNVRLALRGKDGQGKFGAVFYGEAAVFQAPVVEVPITLPAGSWSLGATWARTEAHDPIWLPGIWIAGFVIALVAGAFLFYVLRQAELLRTAVDCATRSLQESENLLNSVFQNMPVGLVIKNADGVIEQFNNTCSQWYGMNEEDFVGRRPQDIENFHSAHDIGLMQNHEQRVLLTGEAQSRQAERRFADGRIHTITITKFPLTDADGKINKVGSINVDVTELVEARQMAEEARMEAERANRGKSAFLANMSHELRTPLNAIIGFSETILAQLYGPIGSEKYREQVEAIHQSGQHLLELVNDILDMSKIESESYALSPQPFAFEATVTETLKLVQALAERKKVELIMELSDRVDEVIADKRAIKQILLNLLSNAIKFTSKEGKVVVRATTSDGNLTVCVEDNGIGIPASEIPEITKPFAKGSNNHTYVSAEGTGLGLSIVASLVGMHNGHLRIDSEVGKGTQITVFLPNVANSPSLQRAS